MLEHTYRLKLKVGIYEVELETDSGLSATGYKNMFEKAHDSLDRLIKDHPSLSQ